MILATLRSFGLKLSLAFLDSMMRDFSGYLSCLFFRARFFVFAFSTLVLAWCLLGLQEVKFSNLR